MSAITPRRSSRLPHTHTPKMSERKKSLFHSEAEASKESMTKHRRLPVVDSESDSDDCDLGIISTLDSSSGDEVDQGVPKTPERRNWHGTRSSKLLRESNDLKNFIKSPFTLNKYQTRYSCPDKNTGSVSTPVTPHMQNHPGTPSSTHSCTSVHTTSSTSSKARKSLASLIADTESCSSSLKDLNFDTDSGTDTKENTPTKSVRRSGRKQKLTPKFQSFKGILLEQKKNVTPPPLKSAVVCLTKMDMSILSPTQMLKTPNTIEANVSPPKLGHNRRTAVEVAESPESCDSEKSHKRLRNNSVTEYGPVSKHPKLDANSAPKARLSLFNSDKLKEILSAKCFYGKSNPDLNATITTKLSNAIEATSTHRRRLFTHSHTHRRKKNAGQINLGVRHRIRKPKVTKNKMFTSKNHPYTNKSDTAILNNSRVSNVSVNNLSMNNVSMLSQNSSQEIDEKDKADPFNKEKETIEALLSQWTEEEVPESELRRPELPCFNSTVIEETNQIFQPITAIPVSGENVPDGEAVIIELGAGAPQKPADGDVTMTELHKTSHGEVPNAKFLPVDGGFILVEENAVTAPTQEELTDLDEIERELKMLDEQILLMTQADEPSAVNAPQVNTGSETEPAVEPHADKLFPIFSKPNPGTSTPGSKVSATKGKKSILRDGSNQYVIDAGQKRFGATQCTECGVIYQIGDPQDEHDHLVHHNATDVLKFNGWKEECVVGRWQSARCVRVRGGELNWRRVAALLARVVHVQLGYSADLPRDTHTYTAYLYIDGKQIVGCAILEPKTRAFKLIPGDPDCCTTEDYPVMCGVSRIWTHPSYRRRGVASRLLDCGRASFLYGAALKPSDMAFSAPTPPGKALATKYCGTDRFYVYLD